MKTKTLPVLPRVQYRMPYVGCDPEIFIKHEDNTPAEAAELLDGKQIRKNAYADAGPAVVEDGIQLELHPNPSHCRAFVVNDVAALITNAHQKLKAKGLKPVEESHIKLTEKELEKMTKEAQKLGCKPSNNLYGASALKVTKQALLNRFAGGHIHLSLKNFQAEPIVEAMDRLLGNTSVMIDTGEEQRLRRKFYGRAGEYRLPAWGLEYRTLSNYWLRHQALMSFVLQMARFCTTFGDAQSDCCYDQPHAWKGHPEIMKAFNEVCPMEDIVKAINNNDAQLAWKNWTRQRPVLEAILPTDDFRGYTNYPLHCEMLDEFENFIRTPIELSFPTPMWTYWLTAPEGHGQGWECWFAANRAQYKKGPRTEKLKAML